ncbi:MAG: hypothetical protein HY084_03365 [Gemmatimonadetes bacterium]|nr:hypothetical protein [Gemmatimonadota bacterium]
MVRRTHRILGALAALWSLVASGSPVPLHQCPVNSAAVVNGGDMNHAGMYHAGTHHAGMRDGGMSHGDTLAPRTSPSHVDQSMAMAGGAEMPAAPTAPANGDDDCCHCLSGCCASAAVALPALTFVVPAARDVSVRDVAFAVPQSPRVERFAHSLPFGNGPPSV